MSSRLLDGAIPYHWGQARQILKDTPHIEVEKEKCNACGLCSSKCPMSLPVMKMVTSGKMKNTDCILCGECVDSCAKKKRSIINSINSDEHPGNVTASKLSEVKIRAEVEL